ncbi:unnamed protein product [Umbelopsis vinacea]
MSVTSSVAISKRSIYQTTYPEANVEQGFEDPDQCFDIICEPNFSLPICPSKFIDDRQDGGYMTIWTSANTAAGLFGHLSYQCEAPAFFCNNVDMQREFTYVQLGRDARRMLATPNAGGASTLSEVMSMELMNRLLGAQISKTEMELAYTTSHTPITDYSCVLPDLDGQPGKRIAVSVTRAMAYRRKFKTADAKRLLTKKLRGVFYSNQTLMNEPIERQILHIWTPSGTAANIVRKIWYKMPRELLCNTIVLVSIVNSHWIFDNRIE